MTLSRPSSPSWTSIRSLTGRDRTRPYLVGELLVVLVLVRVYDIVRSFAATRESVALDHGRDVLSLETWLHIDLEHTLNHWLVHSRPLTDLAAGWYQFIHLTVTLTVLACCYRWRPDVYRRARSSLVLVNVIGLAVYWLYPVAPPRLLPGMGFIDADAIAGFGQGPAGPVSADMFGAMPSLHLAWGTWTVLVLRRLLRDHTWSRRLIPLYACVTALVVMSTANHYVLDVVAGVAVGLVSSLATGLIGEPFRARVRDVFRSPAPSPLPASAPALSLPDAAEPVGAEPVGAEALRSGGEFGLDLDRRTLAPVEDLDVERAQT